MSIYIYIYIYVLYGAVVMSIVTLFNRINLSMMSLFSQFCSCSLIYESILC